MRIPARASGSAIVVLVGLIVADIVRTLLDMYLMQRFIIRWRVWLTRRLTGDWLDGEAYYRGRFLDEPIDNPDQRIQQDIDVFTAGTGAGDQHADDRHVAHAGVRRGQFAIVSVVSFTPILWNLSGPLTLFGVTVPKALFWIGARLRVLRDGRRVLDRPPADPAVASATS